MTRVVAQPDPSRRQCLGKVPSGPQPDQPRVGDTQAVERVPAGLHAIARSTSVAPVILGTGHAVTVAPVVALLRTDRVADKSAVDQGSGHRAVRHPDPLPPRCPPRRASTPASRKGQ